MRLFGKKNNHKEPEPRKKIGASKSEKEEVIDSFEQVTQPKIASPIKETISEVEETEEEKIERPIAYNNGEEEQQAEEAQEREDQDEAPPDWLEDYKKQKSEGIRELFDISNPDDLVTKTETPGSMIIPMVMVEVSNEAINLTRTKRLSQIFMDRFDKRMVSYKRRGRIEVLTALSQQAREDDEDLAI